MSPRLQHVSKFSDSSACTAASSPGPGARPAPEWRGPAPPSSPGASRTCGIGYGPPVSRSPDEPLASSSLGRFSGRAETAPHRPDGALASRADADASSGQLDKVSVSSGVKRTREVNEELVTTLLPILAKRSEREFNVFTVMHHGTHEKQLSNVIAWLLDVDETHKCGDAFLCTTQTNES